MHRSASTPNLLCCTYLNQEDTTNQINLLKQEQLSNQTPEFRLSQEADKAKELFRNIKVIELEKLTASFLTDTTQQWSLIQKIFFLDYLIERRNLLKYDPVAKAKKCIEHFLPEIKASDDSQSIFDHFNFKLKYKDRVIRQFFGLQEIT